LDNAENNDTFIRELEKLLEKRDIPFDAKDHRIQCFPHILNICSGHVVNVLTNAGITEIAEAWVSSLPQDLNDRQTYQEALAQDPIALGHTIVQVMHASIQQRDTFEEYIKEGNNQGYWDIYHNDGRVEHIKIDVLQLIRNVKTWWDSIYYMICHLQYLKEPINRFLNLPNNKDLKKYKLSEMEWNVLRDFKVLLKVRIFLLLFSDTGQLHARFPIKPSGCCHLSICQRCANI
ncbi:hypothetical protein SCLCIDRAFT_145270, partial [Scleroderma citrinum Foug A]